MKLISKTVEIDINEQLTVKNIEKIISTNNEKPLRWSIVQASKDKLVIDAVMIE